MKKNVINNFKIYAMLTAFIMLLISCGSENPNSSTTSETLQGNVSGKWLMKRTCTKSNGSIRYGEQTFQNWIIRPREDKITLIIDKFTGEGQWITTEDYPTPHWAIRMINEDDYNNIYYGQIIDLISINPLKGRCMYLIYNPNTRNWELIAIYDLEGVRQ